MLVLIIYIITYYYIKNQDIIMLEVSRLDKKLQITKKSNLKGDDGYKIFSVRIKDETVKRLDEISAETNRSRNELINLMLEFGIMNCVIED